MKKVVFVLLIAILLFAFCGCAEIVYSTYSTPSGGRIMEWTVTLEEDAISDPSIDMVDYVYSMLEDEAKSRVAKGRNAEVIYDEDQPLIITMRESYESLTAMYIAYGYTGYEENEIQDDEPISLLFTEAQSEVEFVSQSDVDSLSQNFSQLLSAEDYNPSGVVLKYKYGTTYDTVYGLDYDEKYIEDDISYYVWDIDIFDVDDTNIVLAQQIPRVWVWESIAILAGLIVIGAMVLLVVIDRRKKDAQI